MARKLSRAQLRVLEHLAKGRDWLSQGSGARWHIGWLHRHENEISKPYDGPAVSYQTLIWLYDHDLIQSMSEEEFKRSWLRTRGMSRSDFYVITEEGRQALEITEAQA